MVSTKIMRINMVGSSLSLLCSLISTNRERQGDCPRQRQGVSCLSQICGYLDVLEKLGKNGEGHHITKFPECWCDHGKWLNEEAGIRGGQKLRVEARW